MPGRSTPATVSAAARTNDMSGVFVASNGVGTQSQTASAAFSASTEVVGWSRPASTTDREALVGDVVDVAGARGEGLDARAVDVEADRLEARLGVRDREREPDVAQPDDRDPRFADRDEVREGAGRWHGLARHPATVAAETVRRRPPSSPVAGRRSVGRTQPRVS